MDSGVLIQFNSFTQKSKIWGVTWSTKAIRQPQKANNNGVYNLSSNRGIEGAGLPFGDSCMCALDTWGSSLLAPSLLSRFARTVTARMHWSGHCAVRGWFSDCPCKKPLVWFVFLLLCRTRRHPRVSDLGPAVSEVNHLRESWRGSAVKLGLTNRDINSSRYSY